MRVQPKPWIGIVVYLSYLVVFYGVWIALGIDYLHIGDSAETLLKWYVAPLAAGAIVLVVATSVLGWWKPALFDKQPGARWAIIPGALLAVVAIAVLFVKDTSGLAPIVWILAIVGSIGVGFGEEMATRGVLVVGLRARFTEPLVWLISTALFMALHIPNGFFGAGLGVLIQLPLTFGAGTILYLARRSTGTLLVPMLIHGLWDFSTFIGVHTTASSSIGVYLNILLGIFALIVVLITLRKERGTKMAQFGA
ncbi:CPBP family intramembrane metalloprotease [Microbacterium esteraromaticum]|uniref:CPBP family intramembrane metalloprotease n=1 Tax=Microbacterium esteraromaticum TaxID=57043 RepID=A0A939DWQ3_9MICO|nr:CPBP family intramembrane glutamic endopeptidase [Microbacterium esteraromaticum]MBN7794647.1 CPBP family intramembrane metalloprotease [Microbacterium esteraromaticum]MBN8206726.1 CPBP family intramembrane metalloprotease [Microbacterium esteraromaticum]MBN8416881.1 CPBP family intramembrane metalloprotease [Microbacterium esteraromaticum]MBN8425508.1 CPBP family intramembrane metalloprotease [Microbacterium esteraromaticum]